MGNFSICVTVDGIHELFGLRSTKYLRDNCRVEMPMRSHDHFEEARSRRKSSVRSNPQSRPNVINNSSEN